jgi:hypothetical protein
MTFETGSTASSSKSCEIRFVSFDQEHRTHEVPSARTKRASTVISGPPDLSRTMLPILI